MKPVRQVFRLCLHGHSAGTTLVELLASMVILSVLLIVLGSTLEVALGRFRTGAERVENHGGVRVVSHWMERDLQSHLSSRPANLPRLPEGTTRVQREFFEKRLFLPFEINRVSGTGMGEARSFQNAAPEFDSCAFATLLSTPGTVVNEADPAVVGYYVAYTMNSPLSGDEAAGMKLFRHFRRGGQNAGDAYAGGLILFCSNEINDSWDEFVPGSARRVGVRNPAALRQGKFNNAEFPFLLSRRLANLQSLTPLPATQPWPANPIRERLTAPPSSLQPDRGPEGAWSDPESPLHDSVFPDEAVCDHVIRFDLAPYRRVTLEGGTSELMDATALNRHLGLSGGGEWPALVSPDFIEVTIATVSEKAALTLTSYEDWIIDWEEITPATWTSKRQLIERELQTFRFHIPLPPRAT